MIKESKERLQITVSKELADKIRKYCELTGVSVSGICTVAIAEKLMQYEKAYQVFDKYAEQIMERTMKEGEDSGEKKT